MAWNIGVIGAGNMGGGMARRLHDGGCTVRCRDVDPAVAQALAADGLHAVESPAAAAGGADVLIVAVVDAAQTLDVLFGLDGAIGTLPADATVLLCPTLGPAQVTDVAARVHQTGRRLVEAPMSGGPQRARDGTMSLMVAGAPDDVGRIQPVLDLLSGRIFHVGARLGDGARTKLVNNLIAAANLAAAAEGMALAQHLGLDPWRTLSVIEQSSGQSWIGTDRMRRAMTGDERPLAHTTLLTKDSGLAVQAAHDAGFAVPVGEPVAALFARACEQGHADLDDGSLFRFFGGRSPA